MGNRDLGAERSAPGRDSDFVTKNVTIQATSGSLYVEPPPFRVNGMDACLAGRRKFWAIIGGLIFQKTSDIFPHNRPARRLFDSAKLT
jgi:hypothetical protein